MEQKPNNSISGSKLTSIENQITVYAYYNMSWRSFHMPLHSHDRIEIMYVSKGFCNVIFDNSCLSMVKGDFIFIDADIPHKLEIENEESCRILNIEFGFEKGSGVVNGSELTKASPAIKALCEKIDEYLYFKADENIGALLKKIIQELDESGINDSFLINIMTYELLEAIGRHLKNSESNLENNASYYINKAMSFINNNLSEDLTVSDIAKEVNLHPNYLQRIFKITTKDTLVDYIQKQRIKKAEMLLVYTDISIIDLAMQLGFGSRQYFSYVFKRHKDISPQEYRKQYNKMIFYTES
jgi:AraC-like DNA-binding protein/mannose-6-phosphate isomerase-like protein (cupin superfamily)